MDPFIGEIRLFAGNFEPAGWAFCNGQLLPISQNTALFSILGTTYGGNGTTSFGLPNLRHRAALHQGQGPGLSPRVLGEMGGSATVTLQQNQLPAHRHNQQATSSIATSPQANNAMMARAISPNPPYHEPNNMQPLGPAALGSTGGGQPHNNLQPFMEVNFIISLQGIYPPRP